MTANQLIVYLNWAIYLVLFSRVLAQAIRAPSRVNIDIALLFSAPTLFALIDMASRVGLLPPVAELRNAITALLLIIAFLLLRLVDDFTATSPWPRRVAGGVTLALAASILLMPKERPPWLFQLVALMISLLLIWGAAQFLRAARRSSGVARRRLQMIATGSLLFVGAFVISALLLIVPAQRDLVILVANMSGLAAGVSYFIGFASPRVLRRAWQEPELRAFLGRAARLPRLPDTQAIIAELERGAAASLGAPAAFVGLWAEEDQALHFSVGAGEVVKTAAMPGIIGLAWRTQSPVLHAHSKLGDPSAGLLGWPSPGPALAAPITAGSMRLGVLIVYMAHTPLFADDDLALMQLLADQAAVILESRMLIDQAARVHAREEATRLKDDFLSAAAHDLKTPLTTLVARAQLLERRALRNPQAAADLASIQVLVQEGERLRRLVIELLDAARAERGLLVGQRSPVDIAAIARAVCARHGSPRHQCVVEAPELLVGIYDPARIEQLLDNLVENGVKYSPAGGTVRVTLAAAGDQALVEVCDEGIGIDATDLPHIFERFYRGGNVDDRRFAGMGLGLFICHSIVAQHEGQIAVSSRAGYGTTFRITLPLGVTAERTVYA